MTTPIEDQKCGNCYFVRVVHRSTVATGAAVRTDVDTVRRCCYDPPSAGDGWPAVKYDDWCACWNDRARTV